MGMCFRAIIAGERRRGTHLDQDIEEALWIFKIRIIKNYNYSHSYVFVTFHSSRGNSIVAAAIAVVKVNKFATVKKPRKLLWMYNTND